jgi:hypothetical protein
VAYPLLAGDGMNYKARTMLYLDRFWKRWEAPNADRQALLIEAASPDWEPIDWMKRQELRGVFEANYGELLAEIEEGDRCQLCRREEWRVKHHVVPLDWGGINADINLVALCHSCHAAIHPWMNVPLAKRIGVRPNGKPAL